MFKKLIAYFIDKHLLANLIFVLVIVGGIICWQKIKKEELPDVTFDKVAISVNYPGATAQEVEYFVTKELEEAIESLDGIYRITSTASQGSTNITVELEKNYPRKDEAIIELKDAVAGVSLPEDITEDPVVRVFETSKKAIIDIALTYKDKHLINNQERLLLQKYALSLENQLINLKQISSVNKKGYFQEEIHIKVDPEKLIHYNIPLSQIKKEIINNNSRQPAGNLEIKNEPKVTINAQLDDFEKLNNLYIQAGFKGRAISLKDVAEVSVGFDRGKEIIKVNGNEGILFNAVKNRSIGILKAIDAVTLLTNEFKEKYFKDVPIDIVLLDDESIDDRNRLSIISLNGLLGFVLILIMLFIFLNKQSSIWVAMGIPFTICFTIIFAWLIGYTINNVTLAAVIIVMGIVVDYAIVVAENISRLKERQKFNSKDAVVKGTSQVFLPILASIVTTCVAFIPLFYFQGRFGAMNKYIPPIIFLMLGASLFEALFILPGHMYFTMSNIFKHKNIKKEQKHHWFEKIENIYELILKKILYLKYFIFVIFLFFLIFGGWILTNKMRFVMFPNEETRDIVISGYADKKADRIDTAFLTKKIEDVLNPYLNKEVVGYRTQIARSRRGGAVEENRFRMLVEIVPKEKRKRSADDLIKLWSEEIKNIKDLNKLVIDKSRWGQDSGSAIEILIQENDDILRLKAAKKLVSLMEEQPNLTNIEIEEPIRIDEYKIGFKREKIKRLSINPADITGTFRLSLAGSILYEIPRTEEKVNVRLTVKDEDKKSLESILNIPVENQKDYLVPLKDLVTIEKTKTPNSISRRDGKRTTIVYADIKKETKKETPLDIAKKIEKTIFPLVVQNQPSTILSFTGEVFDTREAKQGFNLAIFLVLFLIFAILAILYNSMIKPLIIMLAIPFGMVGIIFAFYLHGKLLFGFFACVGALGLAGVVINDSIIMLAKLDKEFKITNKTDINNKIAEIAKTRLKAVFLTTITTVAGVLPTAYGVAGYDAMLADMMLALSWGLLFGTFITLLLIPCFYSLLQDFKFNFLKYFNLDKK